MHTRKQDSRILPLLGEPSTVGTSDIGNEPSPVVGHPPVEATFTFLCSRSQLKSNGYQLEAHWVQSDAKWFLVGIQWVSCGRNQ